MGRKVKCRICGKQHEITDAYKISNGKTNSYYCSQEEYESWISERDKKKKLEDSIYSAMKQTMKYIFQQSSWGELKITVKFFNEKYSLEQISEYVNAEIEEVSKILDNKEFKNEYAKVRYYTAILRNHIEDYFALDAYEPPKKVVEPYIPAPKYKPKQRRRTILEMESED